MLEFIFKITFSLFPFLLPYINFLDLSFLINLRTITSMAATSNLGLQFPGNLRNAKNENVLNTWIPCFLTRNANMLNNKRRSSLVTASYSNGSPQKVDTINGTKVNGIRVVEAPDLSASKLGEESAADVALVTSLRGRFVEGRLVYRQIFAIRSYEIGPDKTATMETLMNFLQVSFTIICINKLIGLLLNIQNPQFYIYIKGLNLVLICITFQFRNSFL